ncbi:MAG: hypothetical protein CM1200mP34_3740 [Verrucomicrobiales bacterium]|nr:MAG: hypothetical protein CM1200mP34_3740 [Verrucomicrobiales bacterium]
MCTTRLATAGFKGRLRPMVLGTAEFFVMGDNRPISSGGVVEAGKILGKIL